jgi:FtsZ-interacting cell division protein ZipA
MPEAWQCTGFPEERKKPVRMKRLCSIVLIACLVLAGCENAQEKARYVKEPLETVDAASLSSVNNAVREARTRLVTVRSRELRAELSNDIDDEYQRMVAQIQETERREKERAAIEAEKKRQEVELEERREEMRLQKERQAQREESRHAAARNRRDTNQDEPQDRNRQAVKDLEVGTRPSLLGDGTQVLVLRNTKHDPADFDLTCYTRGDTAKKTFMLNVPPRSEKHIGFVQGWCGNFKPGERCEAHCDGELLWNRTIH